MNRTNLLGILLAVFFSVGAAVSWAEQGYPNRPVRLIVPYPPGGPTDIMGRTIAQQLNQPNGVAVRDGNLYVIAINRVLRYDGIEGKLDNPGQPVDLTMGYANVIWQGDANAIALRSLRIAESPPTVLNMTGPETMSIRWAAQRFGALFGVEPQLSGQEAPTALLSNAARCFGRFGYPTVSLDQMVQWVAAWVQAGGATLDKPTHFQEREGKF